MDKTHLSYSGTWIEELRQGTLDAYLAILISQLPHLQRLHLGPCFSIEVDLTSLILRSILCGSRSDSRIPGVHTTLHQLYAVTFDRFSSCYDNRAIRNTANVLPFFYLPSLKKMPITIHDPLVPIFPWPTTQPPSSPSLTSLRVVSMRESHLGQLLVTLPRLRSLHWTWCFDPDVEDQFNSPVINLDQLMPALAYVKETLTELIMPAVCSYANRVARPFPLHVQGSIRSTRGL